MRCLYCLVIFVSICSFCVPVSAVELSKTDMPLPLKKLYETPSVFAGASSDGKEKTAAEIAIDQAQQGLRLIAIREAATALAIQAAVQWRYKEIVGVLNCISEDLDHIYDFGPLLEHNGRVLPPIIAEVQNALQITSSVKSVSSQVVYKILQDAKIISVAPIWRAYLDKEFHSIEIVNPILLPKGAEEQKVWNLAVEKGWEIGILQADRVFSANLAYLDRDYRGLCTYKMLAMQNIVAVPMVAEGEYGVLIGNKTLDVDQRIFRITNSANFNAVEKWTPIGNIKKGKP